MATVSTFNIALVASTGRFVSNIARAERQWNSFARSIQRQAKTLPKAIQDALPASLALGRNVAKWAAVATAAISGLSAAGVKLAADFEQSQIAFETLLGSAERAERFLRELEVYARKTPFGFVGLQQASRQLLAYGFTAGQVLDMIEPIGDAVAAMGGSNQMFEAIIRALGQIQAKGKLAAQEFLQLSEQGIPAWRFLADMLGVTIPEAMDMASRGMISSSVAIEAVLTGMTRRFGGAMRRQAETMAGLKEQFVDSVTTIVRGFGQWVVQATGLAGAMRRLTEATERFADVVSLRGFMGALREAFPPWVQPVIVAIAGAIIGGLVPAIVAWLIPALKKLGVSLWATLRPLTPWMTIGAAVAVVAYVLAKNWGNLAEVGQRVWTVLGASAMLGAALVVRGSGVILQALSWIVPALSGVAQGVLEWSNSLRSTAVEAIKSATSVSKVGQEAGSAAGAAEEAAWAQERLAEGLELAQKAAQGGVQSFDEVHQIQENMADFVLPDFPLPDFTLPNIETPTAALAEGLEAMEDAISGIADAAVNAFQRLVESLGPVRSVVQWMQENWPLIGVILEDTAALITTILVPALVLLAGRAAWAAAQTAAAWVTMQAQAVASVAAQVAQIVALAARWVWMGATALAQGARVAAGWIIAMGPIGWAIAAAAALAAAIWYYWGDIVAAVATAQAWFAANVAPVWDRIVAAVLMAWNALATVAGDVWAAILLAIQTVMDWARTVPDIWDQIAGAIGEAWGALASLAESVWSGIWSAVQAVIDWIEETLGPAWQAAVDAVAGAWDTLSTAAGVTWAAIRGAVAAVCDWADSTVGAVWDGVTSAITSAWATVEDVASRVWGGVRTTINAVWTWALDQAGAVWSGVAGAITAAWDGLSAAATVTWGAIRAAISAVWSWAETQASAVWTVVRNSVEGAWDAVSSAAATTWQAVHDAIEAVWTWAESTAASVWTAVANAAVSTWNSLASAASSTWAAIRGSIESALGGLESWAKAVWDGVRKTTDKAWTAIVSDAEKRWTAIRAAVTSGWGKAKNTVANMAAAIEKTIRDMASAVERVVSGLKDKVLGWWDELKRGIEERANAVTNAVRNAWQWLYDVLVGNSIVPDLVMDVTTWFERMGTQATGITGNMMQSLTTQFDHGYSTILGQSQTFGGAMMSWAGNLSTGMQAAFAQAFQGILTGTMSMSQGVQSVLSALGQSVQQLLVNRLAQAASQSLGTFGQWVVGVLSQVGTVIVGVIQQAYATLVAFFAWSGPLAPALAAGVIAAALAGIGSIASQVLGSIRIPGLAQGGIVTGPTLAMVGEGHRREAVIPLERDNVIADSVGQAVFDAMIMAQRFQAASSGDAGSAERELVLRIDGATFARLILPHLVREGQRQGMDVALRPVSGV